MIIISCVFWKMCSSCPLKDCLSDRRKSRKSQKSQKLWKLSFYIFFCIFTPHPKSNGYWKNCYNLELFSRWLSDSMRLWRSANCLLAVYPALFLVACYATLTRYVCRMVRLSVCPSVRRSALAFSALRAIFALLLLPKCLGKPLSSLPLPTRTRLR